MSVLSFFVDPVLRASMIGSMLMCFSTGLIGCLAFLRKRSLIGEALSHAAYPGIVLSLFFIPFFPSFSEEKLEWLILTGAFVTALLGLCVIDRLEKKWKISSDAALCFVLSIFFGIGVLFASRLQFSQALWFRQVQTFLFGQAATMLDVHILLYGGLTFIILITVVILFRFLEILNFDFDFAKTVGMPTALIEGIVYLLLVLSIVVGMRSVGVVLISAMLIAPAVAARLWTRRLSSFFCLASFLGVLVGFLGNALSIWIPNWLQQPKLTLPTGPMIVLSAAFVCIFSFIFAPQKGLLVRFIKVTHFQMVCAQENILKALYKGQRIKKSKWLFLQMQWKGWVKEGELTEIGYKEAEKLVRVHRLWEVYLVYMGQGLDRVHRSAEEMEHILTPEIEKQLQQLLDHPLQDPHHQPIPKERG